MNTDVAARRATRQQHARIVPPPFIGRVHPLLKRLWEAMPRMFGAVASDTALVSGVPAVLIAFSISPDLALYTVLLFVGVQLVEGYLLQPLIESRAVDLPPALTIVMQLVFGTLFGFAGVALATPLAAALKVLVQMLYVEDVLGDKVEEET